MSKILKFILIGLAYRLPLWLLKTLLYRLPKRMVKFAWQMFAGFLLGFLLVIALACTGGMGSFVSSSIRWKMYRLMNGR